MSSMPTSMMFSNLPLPHGPWRAPPTTMTWTYKKRWTMFFSFYMTSVPPSPPIDHINSTSGIPTTFAQADATMSASVRDLHTTIDHLGATLCDTPRSGSSSPQLNTTAPSPSETHATPQCASWWLHVDGSQWSSTPKHDSTAAYAS